MSELKQPFPKFMIGQTVEAYGHEGKITAIRQLDEPNDKSYNEYTFENSFPSNAWFAESELHLVEYAEIDALRQQIAKLEADNKRLERERDEAKAEHRKIEDVLLSYRDTALQAQAENKRIAGLAQHALQVLSFPNSYLSDTEVKELLRQIVQSPASPAPVADAASDAVVSPAPKFKEGDNVRIVSHIDNAIGKVIGASGYKYKVERLDGITDWYPHDELIPFVSYTEASAPVATLLTDEELSTLAKMYTPNGELHTWTMTPIMQDLEARGVLLHQRTQGSFTVFVLGLDYDVPSIRAAIKARRKAQGN